MRFPGRVHDSRVFKKTLGVRFEDGYRPFPGAVLLADSAYSCSDYVIRMISNPPEEQRLFYE